VQYHPVHAEPISHLPKAGGKERLLHRHQYLTPSDRAEKTRSASLSLSMPHVK
jgi:hypothetical protein